MPNSADKYQMSKSKMGKIEAEQRMLCPRSIMSFEDVVPSDAKTDTHQKLHMIDLTFHSISRGNVKI